MNSTAHDDAAQTVLLVDDDEDFRMEMARMLAVQGIAGIETLDNGIAALERLEAGDVALLILDMVMPGISGIDLISIILQTYPELPIIMVTAINDADSIVSCIKLGAFDYLTKPVDSGRLYTAVSRGLSFSEMSRQNRRLKKYLLGEPLTNPQIFRQILTVNSRMLSLFRLVETFARTLQPVLIRGETGVGKELMARAVHDASGVSGEFVAINVSGLDATLFADTLFGHRKGAFTGANETREGLIKKAEGGTLFLDEIGDLNEESQKALLRLIQEKEFYRLGSDVLYRSSARIIAATNSDLEAQMAAGRFRRDLYHRLAIHELNIPPLRERREDIPLLAQHFAAAAAAALDRELPPLTPEERHRLAACDFPGNVRELQNMISNAVAVARPGESLLQGGVELKGEGTVQTSVLRVTEDRMFTLQAVFDTFPTIAEMEQLLVQEALKISEGYKSVAAGLLGISRPTLNKKLAESQKRES